MASAGYSADVGSLRQQENTCIVSIVVRSKGTSNKIGSNSLEARRHKRHWASFFEELPLDRHSLVTSQEEFVHELLDSLGRSIPERNVFALSASYPR